MATPLQQLAQWGPSWLASGQGDRLWQLAEQRWLSLQGRPAQRVLIVHTDAIAYLADWIAAVSAGWPVILGNPRWRRQEWEIVATQLQPQQIWGAAPIAAAAGIADPSETGWIGIATGGSSGGLRFAIQTWDRLMAAAIAFQRSPLIDGPAIAGICSLPLHHVSGLMVAVRSLVTGGSLWLLPWSELQSDDPLPDCPQAVLSLVPTQLQRLLLRRSLWLQQRSLILLGGAPAWPTLLQQAQAQQLSIAPCYGATETAAFISVLAPQQFLAGDRGVGKPLPGVTIKLNADQTVAIQAPSLALGYWQGTSQLQPIVDDQGFWQSGDRGEWSADHSLILLGRQGDRILSGGEKIWPLEVETALYNSGLVREVCVVGLADSDWGEVVAAAYVPQSEGTCSAQLKAAIALELAAYKHPKRWISCTALPRTSQGKIDRVAVRQFLQSMGH
ncbi:AMP-binding enzyme [Synechococcus elongatus]|uniref:AMP-binding protein n=1 Tax=Synechococcus elongatus PCC 11802 TaxID=2283154 RepID=A0AAT9JVD3_SYNEL|nr:AMP-binding protein [Synechococcus elongatus]QFZ92648.1 2-succinylbenzoate--CoA ligase [Synechococcus elongatus PCC 11802]